MKNSVVLNLIVLGALLVQFSCRVNSNNSSKEEKPMQIMTKTQLEDEAWQMEELYWEYVQKSDTVNYKTLWHDDFIGYPSFGNGVSDVSKIASWIPDLHKDPNLKFRYILHKKASNAIEDVVMVFYDADEIWTNKQNQVVRKETYKFTHTWKKVDGKWVILGGMAAEKKQKVLNN
ncbi:MAG: nuclear transport factor 2 family protein [Cyclobacterium sp.]|nr:nuclear transport factor 2 family protein [Cyclobacterium sp.]